MYGEDRSERGFEKGVEMKPDIYMPLPAKIEDIVDETPTIKTFFIRPEQPLAYKAGQFVELTVPGKGEAPFTPSSSPAVAEKLEVTIMKVGHVTEHLHAMEPGAEVGIRGPLGTAYPLESFYGKNVVIVGGGVGLAPLRALLLALLEEADKFPKIYIRYGARTPEDIVYKNLILDKWQGNKSLDVLVTVDNGDENWKGRTGVVTTNLLNDLLPVDPKTAVAVVCGPPIMMRFGTFTLLDLGYAPETIYLSMEKNMSCGVGKCGHCRIGNYYACKDGPVFTYDKIQHLQDQKIWE